MTDSFHSRNSALEISPLIASEQKLLMMSIRFYQVKQIVNCIHHDCGNGTIWPTTGKTLTSLKAAPLPDTPLPKPLNGELSLDEFNSAHVATP